MWLACQAAADGRADSVVSAGNTGALLAISMFAMRMLDGAHRPALASFLPTSRGETVMLDLGANLECDADNLAQFAVMGSVFAQVLLGLDSPKVGLLNVGSEELKGHEELRTAAAWLRRDGSPINFHGFVEGNDIGSGTVDVVVTDGFTGNVALKSIEGTAKLYTSFVRDAFRTSTFAKIGYLFASGAWIKLRKRVDPRRYNGGVFLGLDGICVKSHGGTDAAGLCLCDRRGCRPGALRVQEQARRGPGQAPPGHLRRRRAGPGAAGQRRGSVIRSVVQAAAPICPNGSSPTTNSPRRSTPRTSGSGSAPASASATSRPTAS